MSQQYQSRTDESINTSVVTFVIMTAFVLVSILVFSQLPGQNKSDTQVAQAATPTSQPSATPLPPTQPPTQPPTAAPSATPTELPPTATSAPTVVAEAASADAVGAATGYDPGLVARGQQQFLLCSACHGPDGRGLPNLGKDLVASEFIHSQTDEELLTFIKTGRPIWDPLNTTGIDMPPKGGNPALSDEDILAIIAYIRSLSAQ
ncbi:MAG: cytochrome c [Chloroflexi bacterium]|nr:cytochrome c [Chloroflexota bacterium]